MKYDTGHPSNPMWIRPLISAVVMLVSSLAEAEPAALWQAVAAPPRGALPAVTVEVGYPGAYVPSQNFPLTLRATAGDAPFNGYIGFHFRSNERRTHETPVIARALLRPGESWTFSTFASLRPLAGLQYHAASREIAIEWRDASMKVQAVQNAGTPPWTVRLMPLRIETAEESSSLSDRAQWYAGFSDVIAPLAVWADLPRRVREAILGSGINVVLFGFPRSGQKLDDIDRALLPVIFDVKPGSYQAPWPYGDSTAVETTLSWRVKNGSTGVGTGPLPYMVRSAAATWVADERGVQPPLPATAAIPTALQVAKNRSLKSNPDFQIGSGPSHIVREYPAFLIALIATLLSLAGWLILRKRQHAAATIGLLIGAIFLLAARDRVRPASGIYRYAIETPVAPGILNSLHLSHSYGSSSIGAEGDDAERTRTSISSGSDYMQDAEVRTSNTPVSMGVMKRRGDWNAVTRWSHRRELGDTPSIRIRSREENKLVLDYESALPINYIYAQWLCGEGFCSGATAVRSGSRGSATIRSARKTSTEFEPFVWENRETRLLHHASTTRVSLVHRTRRQTHILQWLEPATTSGSFVMSGSSAFALPRDVAPNSTALVGVRTNTPSPVVNLAWATGSTTLAPTGRDGLLPGTRSYRMPPEVLRGILESGGIVNVTLSSDPHPLDTVSIEIWEKKP